MSCYSTIVNFMPGKDSKGKVRIGHVMAGYVRLGFVRAD